MNIYSVLNLYSGIWESFSFSAGGFSQSGALLSRWLVADDTHRLTAERRLLIEGGARGLVHGFVWAITMVEVGIFYIWWWTIASRALSHIVFDGNGIYANDAIDPMICHGLVLVLELATLPLDTNSRLKVELG